VAHDNYGSPVLDDLISKNFTDVPSSQSIEGGRRFICEKNGRIPCQRSCNRNALLLSGAEIVRFVLQPFT
jgi:hypothetical protein